MPQPNTQQFQQISQELYSKNVELLYANKEMALVQELYQILISSDELEDTAQRCLDLITKQLNCISGLVVLANKSNTKLSPVAVSHTQQTAKAAKLLPKDITELQVPTSSRKNLMADVHRHGRRRVSHDYHQILYPAVEEEVSDQLQDKAEIETILIFPLELGDKKLGVMTLSYDRKTTDLSKFERQVLKQIAPIVSIALDRTMLWQDLQDTTTKLRAANRSLRQLDKLKDEFISIASHELRTPMTALRGFLWMANQHTDKMPKKVQGYIERSLKSAEHLVDLTKDILDVSRIEGERLELQPIEFNLTELVQDIVAEFEQEAKERGHSLTAPTLPPKVMVCADPDRIRQVIINLISNALKYSQTDSSITVLLKKDAGQAEVSVVDEGPGIAKSDQAQLFNKFSRLQNNLGDGESISGTGLGLYIAKQIITLSNGQVGVESDVGQGSRFYFSLPLANKKSK